MPVRKVLLVEDEVSIADPFEQALTRHGFETSIARRAGDALRLAREDPPDVVLLDLTLPDGDGRDVCRELRRVSDVPVIMVTARGTVTVAHAILRLPPPSPAPAMFWSDQHHRRIQLVGHAPPEGRIELDGDPSAGPFAAWITRDGQPAGALLVDRPNLLPRARRWIGDAHLTTADQHRRAA